MSRGGGPVVGARPVGERRARGLQGHASALPPCPCVTDLPHDPAIGVGGPPETSRQPHWQGVSEEREWLVCAIN